MNHVSLSLCVGALAVLVSLPFGIACAWLFERTKISARGLLQTVVMLPLVLPPAVTGLALLWVFSPRHPLGEFLTRLGIPVAFHFLGAVVAAAVVGFPLLVMNISLAFKAIDSRMEMISQSLGRSPWQTFWRVTLPLSYPGILAGVVLAFARGLGEFGATIVLAGRISGETDTLSLAIYALLDEPGHGPQIALLICFSVAMGVAAIFISRFLENSYRRRLELL